MLTICYLCSMKDHGPTSQLLTHIRRADEDSGVDETAGQNRVAVPGGENLEQNKHSGLL